MIARIHATAAAVLVLCMFAVAALVIAHHPAARPLVGLPIIATLVWIFFAGAPWITPRGRNLLRAQSAYGTIWLAMTSLLAIVFGVMVARLLHAHPAHGIIFVGFGIVLIVIGNLCAKLPPNRLAGVRTPWALADDENWDKTQRLGGWCLVIAGFVIINAALLLDIKSTAHVVMGSVLIAGAISMAGSWNWARLKRRAASGKKFPAQQDFRTAFSVRQRTGRRSEMHQGVSGGRAWTGASAKLFSHGP